MTITGCTTTKIVSQKFDNLSSPYNHFAIFVVGESLLRKKAAEDRIVESFYGEGIRAIQGYKAYAPTQNQSLEGFTNAVLASDIDAVIVITRTGDTSNVYTLYGSAYASASDNSGKAYTYERPTSESYISAARTLKTAIIDVKRNKVVWRAESESRTLSPAEISMFTDFYDSSIKSFTAKLIDEMKGSGMVRLN